MLTGCIYAILGCLKDERPTSNIERRTSNNDVALLLKLF